MDQKETKMNLVLTHFRAYKSAVFESNIYSSSGLQVQGPYSCPSLRLEVDCTSGEVQNYNEIQFCSI